MSSLSGCQSPGTGLTDGRLALQMLETESRSSGIIVNALNCQASEASASE